MADEVQSGAPGLLPDDPGREGVPVARLAASQLRRVRRIVDAAVSLAEEGGFDGVRLRDVAEASGVALGTLYKYFRSKEDILLFAVNEEAEKLEEVLRSRPVRGEDAVERVAHLFARATRGMTRKPQLAKAVLRAISSGDEEMAAKVAGFHLRIARLIVGAIRDEPPRNGDLRAPVGTSHEQALATILSHVWFASLVGWAGGLHPTREVTERVRLAAELTLRAPAPGGAEAL